MTKYDMKKQTLALIEEVNPDSEYLTDDPDIQAKIDFVMNQVMHELIRFKKIPKYVEIEVSEGDFIDFSDIERACGYEIYQVGTINGVRYSSKADGTVFKMLEGGTAEINCYVYPEAITEKTKDKAYEFELSADVLNIMPYGIAANLLKSDVSAEYGRIYADAYKEMKQMLDPRYKTSFCYVDGGIKI